MDSSNTNNIVVNTNLVHNDVRNIYPSYNQNDPTDSLNRYKTLVEFAQKYKDPVLHYPYVCKETRDIILKWLKH